MSAVWTIAGKELRSSFVTPIAYVIIAGFMLVAGFFFFGLLMMYNSNIYQTAANPASAPNLNEWVVYPFYKTLEVIFVFLVPILTMRAFAEEKHQNTFELLATSPLRVSDIVLGKFIGLATVSAVMLLLSFVYPLVLILFTDPEVLPILVGLFGLLLFTTAFLALGLTFSALTKNQTVAGVMGLVFLLLLYVIDLPAGKLPQAVASLLDYLSPPKHTEFMLKGVLDGTDIVYFVSLTLIGLFLTSRILESERFR